MENSEKANPEDICKALNVIARTLKEISETLKKIQMHGLKTR